MITIVVALKYGYASYFFASRRKQMHRVNALISNFRLRLKAKLRKKIGSLSPYGTSELKVVLTEIISELSQLEFNDPGDYQKLIQGIAKINETVEVEDVINGDEHIKEFTADVSLVSGMETLKKSYDAVFEFDKDVVLFVVEICKLTEQYLILAEQYNRYTEYERGVKKITDLPPKIDIKGFYLLEDIYNRYRDDLTLMKSLKSESKADSNNTHGQKAG